MALNYFLAIGIVRKSIARNEDIIQRNCKTFQRKKKELIKIIPLLTLPRYSPMLTTIDTRFYTFEYESEATHKWQNHAMLWTSDLVTVEEPLLLT